jgi:hypothetical protein
MTYYSTQSPQVEAHDLLYPLVRAFVVGHNFNGVNDDKR